jgi:hypothetical protein
MEVHGAKRKKEALPFRQIAAQIDGVHTDVLLTLFEDVVHVVVTQRGKVGHIFECERWASTMYGRLGADIGFKRWRIGGGWYRDVHSKLRAGSAGRSGGGVCQTNCGRLVAHDIATISGLLDVAEQRTAPVDAARSARCAQGKRILAKVKDFSHHHRTRQKWRLDPVLPPTVAWRL